MSHALTAPPCPETPIYYACDHSLLLRCLCGREDIIALDAVAASKRVAKDTRIGKFVDRLRCQECGERPALQSIEPTRKCRRDLRAREAMAAGVDAPEPARPRRASVILAAVIARA